MAAGDHGLRSLLGSYNNINLALSDTVSMLSQFKDLRPYKKPFKYGNGQVKHLVNLEGTIPVTYKGKLYNIPIIIWLHETHPYNAPMVYVQPTATMNIKAGPHVDASGSVTMPYLKDWKQGQSDLSTLVSVLCMVFGESPPVFAKPKKPASTSAAGPSPQPPYPVSGPTMPQPGQQYGNVPASGGYPPPPTYPPPTGGYPSSTANSTTAPTSQGYNPYGPAAPVPPYPTAAPTTTSTVGGYPGMGTGYGTGMMYPTPSTAAQNYQAQTNSGFQQQQNTAPYPTTNTNTGYPSYPAPTYTNPAAAPDNSGIERQKSVGLSDEQIKESLLSAVEGNMRRRLKEIFSTHKAEMDVLRKTQDDLTAGRDKLESIKRATETETNECETTFSILSSAIDELKLEIDKADTGKELSPEEAIETTAPIYKQLMQSFAEEQAIEDTLYILAEALRKETIGIELYLKKVRDLSRKQFMLRALIQKCREKAGLSDI